MTRLGWMVVAIAAAACSSEETLDATSSATGSGAAGGGGGGGGEGGSVDERPCELELGWTASASPLPTAVDHHGTFVLDSAAGPHLFVAGGNDYQSVYANVWAAPIGADHMPGAFAETTAMPKARAGMAVATHGGFVVLVAGRTPGLVDVPDVIVATTAGDGIGPWLDGPAIPAPRFHASAAIAGDFIYVSGGLGMQQATDTVFRTRIGDDGVLEPWITEAPMPQKRSHHVSFAYGDHLYVAGGLEGNPAGQYTTLTDVQRAVIGADGALGPWEVVSQLEVALTTAAPFLRGRCVHLVAGLEGQFGGQSDKVRRAELDAMGGVGPWQTLATPLLAPRSHVHQVPFFDEAAYFVGGSVSLDVVTDAVAVGTFH